MLYHLIDLLHRADVLITPNPFRYETFRAGVALVMALLITLTFGQRTINILRALKAGQPIRTATSAGALSLADMHGKKSGTPTMGGVLIVASILIPTLLLCNLTNPYVWLLVLVTFTFGFLGFMDDYLKVSKKNADGLSARAKMLWQLGIGLFVGLYLYAFGSSPNLGVEYAWRDGGTLMPVVRGFDHVLVPFVKDFYPQLGAAFILYVVFVLVATSNAVNLTDGLDGLCIGISTIVSIAFAILVYLCANKSLSAYLMIPHVPMADEVVVVMGALIGACLGFLWFNAHPAEVFMGDTGSMSLGGLIGTIALVTKQEVLLVIIGGIYVIEALSVIIQVTSYKLTGKRVFLMSPLHHHFEKKGMDEAKIIARFWIVSAVLALIGLSTLRLR